MARQIARTGELPPIYVTITEASILLRFSTRHIRRLIALGELEAVGKGRGKRVLYASVLAHPFYRKGNLEVEERWHATS